MKKQIILVAGGMLLVAIGIALIPIVDRVVRHKIKKKVIISNTSELYEVWQDIPVPVYMQFYMFNVENVDEILEGGRPYVIQKGPYTYRERRVKYDIVWNPNGTVTYKQNRTFDFVREMSIGSDADEITTINPLIATLAQGFQWRSQIIRVAISFIFKLLYNEGLFITRPVKELLWGYEDPALVKLNWWHPSSFPSTEIGYFIRRNDTDDGLYTVVTGEEDIENLGKIDHFNGETHIQFWTTDWAGMVNGSDGTLGPPFSFNADKFEAFVSDLCRSIKGVYSGVAYTSQGIELRRFGGDPLDMVNATANPDNIGFCTPQSKCLPSGLLNATLCEKSFNDLHAPLIFSFPHFLNAAPEVANAVDGMHPNKDEHDTYIDVEPWTGLVLQVAKRLQVNMFVEQVDGISQTSNIQTMYFPIFWLNESSVTDDKHANMLKDQLFHPLLVVRIMEIVLICTGSLITILGIGLLVWNRLKERKAHQHEAVDQEEDKAA